MSLTHRAINACCLIRIQLPVVGKPSFQDWQNPTKTKMELNSLQLFPGIRKSRMSYHSLSAWLWQSSCPQSRPGLKTSCLSAFCTFYSLRGPRKHKCLHLQSKQPTIRNNKWTVQPHISGDNITGSLRALESCYRTQKRATMRIISTSWKTSEYFPSGFTYRLLPGGKMGHSQSSLLLLWRLDVNLERDFFFNLSSFKRHVFPPFFSSGNWQSLDSPAAQFK